MRRRGLACALVLGVAPLLCGCFYSGRMWEPLSMGDSLRPQELSFLNGLAAKGKFLHHPDETLDVTLHIAGDVIGKCQLSRYRELWYFPIGRTFRAVRVTQDVIAGAEIHSYPYLLPWLDHFLGVMYRKGNVWTRADGAGVRKARDFAVNPLFRFRRSWAGGAPMGWDVTLLKGLLGFGHVGGGYHVTLLWFLTFGPGADAMEQNAVYVTTAPR